MDRETGACLPADQRPIIFAMHGATDIALGIERWIAENWIKGFRLADKEEWRRHDRESYTRSEVNVRGRKVYIVTSFASDDIRAEPAVVRRTRHDGSVVDEVRAPESVDEKIWATILFVHSLVDASAANITLIGTFLPYTRQDQKDQPRALIGTSAFVKQMRAAGVNRIIGMDVHNTAAMQNSASAADIRFDHLESRVLLAKAAAEYVPHGERVVIETPDPGATKRSKKFQATFAKVLARREGVRERRVGFAHADKVRMPGAGAEKDAEVATVIEQADYPIKDSLVISPDDIVATGGTIRGNQQAVEARGGKYLAAVYTHGLFTGKAAEKLADVQHLIGTTTVDPWRVRGTAVEGRLRLVDVSGVFARAIMETHCNGSINDLLQELETGTFGG